MVIAMMWFGIVLIVMIALYLLAIMPAVGKSRKSFHKLDGFYYAHRGLFDPEKEIPENSLPAFRRAVEKGFGIELDVQLTKDKKLVVFHDFTFDRMCGLSRRVEELTYEEIVASCRLQGSAYSIPTFSQVLEIVQGKVPLIIEVKVPYMNMDVCELLMKELQDYDGVYCVESFHPLVLRWMKLHEPQIIRGQLSTNFLLEKHEGNKLIHSMLGALLFNFLGRPDFIAYNLHFQKGLSLWLCRHLYGVRTAAWTVRSVEELKASQKRFSYYIFDSFIPEDKL